MGGLLTGLSDLAWMLLVAMELRMGIPLQWIGEGGGPQREVLFGGLGKTELGDCVILQVPRQLHFQGLSSYRIQMYVMAWLFLYN